MIKIFCQVIYCASRLTFVFFFFQAQEINSPDANASIAFQNKAMDASSAESAINSLEGEQNEMGVMKKDENKLSDHSPTVGRTVMNIKHGSQVKPAENDPRGASTGTSDGLNAKAMDIKL